MGYVLINREGESHAPPERRAENALAALRAYTAYLRQDCDALIRDGAGEPVSLPQLLEEATRQVADPTARRRLAAALADHVHLDLYPWDDKPRLEYPPDSYWRRAGETWAREFRQTPPQMLLEELSHRHLYPRCNLLVRSAADELIAMRRVERAEWARNAGAFPSPPTLGSRPSSGRRL